MTDPANPADGSPLLAVNQLSVQFEVRGEVIPAVADASFTIDRGECLGVVGESGSGKSVTARSIIGLQPFGATMRINGSAVFDGSELIGAPERVLRGVRGKRIGMVFQDPMSSLNPVLSIGAQLTDMLRQHQSMTKSAARRRALELLDEVGIVDPQRRIDDHPHQFSGGMRQRVLIAMAISCEPELLIADEPTTALDVSVQAQILRLLTQLRAERSMALMLITHDLGVVAGLADRVVVMRHGRVVETAGAEDLFARPQADYTKALLEAVPRLDSESEERDG